MILYNNDVISNEVRNLNKFDIKKRYLPSVDMTSILTPN
jgi:hypothetical protein